MKGLEPLLLSKLDPKSSASTNSATPACAIFEGAKIQLLFIYRYKIYFFTSKASLSAFPMSMKANTKSMMAIPGSMAR